MVGGSLSYAILTRQTSSTAKTRPWISHGSARVSYVYVLTRACRISADFSLRGAVLSRPVDTPFCINRSATSWNSMILRKSPRRVVWPFSRRTDGVRRRNPFPVSTASSALGRKGNGRFGVSCSDEQAFVHGDCKLQPVTIRGSTRIVVESFSQGRNTRNRNGRFTRLHQKNASNIVWQVRQSVCRTGLRQSHHRASDGEI